MFFHSFQMRKLLQKGHQSRPMSPARTGTQAQRLAERPHWTLSPQDLLFSEAHPFFCGVSPCGALFPRGAEHQHTLASPISLHNRTQPGVLEVPPRRGHEPEARLLSPPLTGLRVGRFSFSVLVSWWAKSSFSRVLFPRETPTPLCSHSTPARPSPPGDPLGARSSQPPTSTLGKPALAAGWAKSSHRAPTTPAAQGPPKRTGQGTDNAYRRTRSLTVTFPTSDSRRGRSRF